MDLLYKSIKEPYLTNFSFEEYEVPVLRYSKLDIDGFSHCFTTKMGGVSTGIFESMNLSFTRGDDYDAVFENYNRIARVMESDINHFVCSDQTHTTNVLVVTNADLGCGLTKDRHYSDIDGLVTNEAGIVLSTFFADCVPLYFIDPINKAIGLSHSGWRGTVGRIGQKTIELMTKTYGTNPRNVVCAIGPSICQDCYEISEDVALEFEKEFEGHFDEILISKGNGKYQLDLWAANKIVLLESGILEENLSVTNLCTCCNSKYLFSHRATNGKRGNLAAFLKIN